MSTPTSEFLNAAALPPTARPDGRPLRDPRIEQLAGSILAWEFMLQGKMTYAGDAADPRPVRPRSLHDVKQWIASSFPGARYRGAFPEATLLFAFCSDRVKMGLEEAIPVPREDLWWLAAPGDTLLLSDRRTHHYIRALQVDDAAQRIHMLDPWPERVFLREGLNTAGVEAVVEPVGAPAPLDAVQRVSITREEFRRTAVGLITFDTPELIEGYLAHRPEARARFDVQLAFGLALVDAEKYVLARHAAARFAAALRLAEAEPAADRVVRAAGQLHAALVAASYRQRASNEPLAAKPFEDQRRSLVARYGEEALLEPLRSRDLCSLAHAAAATGDYDGARRLLDLAVGRGPEEEEPRRLRAKVRLTLRDHAGALEDVTRALALGAEAIRALEARRDGWHPEDRSSREHDDALIGGRRERRFDELDMRVASLIALGRLDEARAAAHELIAHAPDQAAGYAKLAAVEQLLGEATAALAHLHEARTRERDPRALARLDALLGKASA